MVHRRDKNIGRQLEDIEVQIGDTLLPEGAIEDIQPIAMDMEMVSVAHPTERAYRRRHAPLVIALMLGVLVAVGLLGGNVPVLVLVFALLALAAFVVLRRVVGVTKSQVKVWDKDING